MPAVAAVMPAYDHETEWTKQVRGLSRHSCVQLQLQLQLHFCRPQLFHQFLILHHISLLLNQVASDCIWSDPASEVMERSLDETGFGDSPRGGGAVWYVSYFVPCSLLHISNVTVGGKRIP